MNRSGSVARGGNPSLDVAERGFPRHIRGNLGNRGLLEGHQELGGLLELQNGGAATRAFRLVSGTKSSWGTREKGTKEVSNTLTKRLGRLKDSGRGPEGPEGMCSRLNSSCLMVQCKVGCMWW